MGGHYLVLPIEHQGELTLLLQQLFQQFSQCPYLDLEVDFRLLAHLMMDFLLINLRVMPQHKIFSSTGVNDDYLLNLFVINFISRCSDANI